MASSGTGRSGSAIRFSSAIRALREMERLSWFDPSVRMTTALNLPFT